MRLNRLFPWAFSLAGVTALAAPARPEPARALAPAAAASQPPRYLTTAVRPTALLLREGVAFISDERRFLQRVPLGGAGASQSFWSPAVYPPRLLDGGGGTVIIADQHGETIKRITAESQPWAEDLAHGQQVRTLARDATHLYWINLAPPHLRRVPLRPLDLARSRPVVPPLPPDTEAVAYLAEELVDLAVDAGEVFLANAPRRSLQRLRAGGRPETVATFAQPPTTLYLTADTVFVGSRGGTVYRVERASGSVAVLGQARGDVSALSLAGCLLLVGTNTELIALEASRGTAVPLAAAVSVTGVAASGGRVVYADYQGSALYELPLPACPGPQAIAATHPAPPAPAPTADPPPPPSPVDPDPLAGKSRAAAHTVLVRFASATDQLPRPRVRSGVERVLGEAALELWARASEPQVAALQQDGFDVVYRDGVDRVRCTDVRHNPEAARRPPPAPFFESGQPKVFLVQLNVGSQVLPELQSELAASGVTLLETEGATLTVAASPSAIARLARRRYVTWTGAYSVRERLVSLGPEEDAPSEPCAGDPDRMLRRLAAWVQKQPQAPLKLTAVLFASSSAFIAAVRHVGGRIDYRDEQTVTFTIKRAALPAVAAHPDVRVLEAYSEPSVD